MYLAFSAMAARSDIAPARWRKPFLNWMDGIEAGWAIPLLLIGFIMGAFTERKQTLHDLIASTLVVRDAPGGA